MTRSGPHLFCQGHTQISRNKHTHIGASLPWQDARSPADVLAKLHGRVWAFSDLVTAYIGVVHRQQLGETLLGVALMVALIPPYKLLLVNPAIHDLEPYFINQMSDPIDADGDGDTDMEDRALAFNAMATNVRRHRRLTHREWRPNSAPPSNPVPARRLGSLCRVRRHSKLAKLLYKLPCTTSIYAILYHLQVSNTLLTDVKREIIDAWPFAGHHQWPPQQRASRTVMGVQMGMSGKCTLLSHTTIPAGVVGHTPRSETAERAILCVRLQMWNPWYQLAGYVEVNTRKDGGMEHPMWLVLDPRSRLDMMQARSINMLFVRLGINFAAYLSEMPEWKGPKRRPWRERLV